VRPHDFSIYIYFILDALKKAYLVFDMSLLQRPLSNVMLEVLMDCYEGEFLNLDPHDVSTVRSASALIKRGLLTVEPYINKKGKRIFGIYLTNAGRNYLKNI
jgi:hypothetical protein